ncbi:MFS superfamily transporter protein [Gracilibacillus halophilus YIM-C55.5]|uniref:MFS superfamily transporter protein n=1 Tax=Gracilibacillus halophilus YIM-C55.5 TaxID=1308866 RepID=N4WMW1_9BACI|nr:MFS transporter [Gracilibacillus halophilus]ENH97482.1 MFS superfamily transporter protein [Gracilibacillus halophilus YIM-C55.5]
MRHFNWLWNQNIPVNRDLVLLLTIGGLYSLATFLSNTFVNVFLWKQSGEYIDIALYNLFVYLLQPTAFLAAGKLAKKVDRTMIIRLGVIVLSLFYITVLVVGDVASQIPMLLGAILGIGSGFYWLAFNVLTFEVTEPETRDFFNGSLGTLQSFGNMIGPIFAGYIITQMDNFKGYSLIFFLSFVLFVLAVVCSFFLKKRKATGHFYFRKVLKEKKRNSNWKNILYAHVFQGLREGLFIFIIAIWVFVVTGSEFKLGTFNFVLAFCSFIGYFVIVRLINKEKRATAIFIAGITLYVAISIFIFYTTYTTLVIYAIVIGFAYPIFNVPFVSLTYDVIGKSKNARELRIEYVIIRELFINVGRVCAIGLFLVCVLMFDPVVVIPILLLTLGSGNFIAYFFVRNIQLL